MLSSKILVPEDHPGQAISALLPIDGRWERDLSERRVDREMQGKQGKGQMTHSFEAMIETSKPRSCPSP